MKCEYCHEEATSIDMLMLRCCEKDRDNSKAAESLRKQIVMQARMETEHKEMTDELE
jgi:hypothetical protein